MTRRFPIDAPIRKVVAALELPGFHMVREGNHIAMVRENSDGARTPLTMPNHARLNTTAKLHAVISIIQEIKPRNTRKTRK